MAADRRMPVWSAESPLWLRRLREQRGIGDPRKPRHSKNFYATLILENAGTRESVSK